MKRAGILGNFNGILFFSVLLAVFLLEIFGQVFEQAVGYYLKWENHTRPQLGRIWERDRQNLAAQKKIESILSSVNLQEESSDSLQSFKELFSKVDPSVPQLVSRDKFLQLYYDFPGPWPRNMISPYDLVEIDSNKNWRRVLLTSFGPWITISFIDSQNFPIREVFVSEEKLEDVQSTRTVQSGSLEQAGFQDGRIFTVQEFLRLIRKLDPKARQILLPEPEWFLKNNFHISRVGILEDTASNRWPHPYILGIEYQNDFFTDVLVTPVPFEIAQNILSQMERPFGHNPGALFREFELKGELD